VSSDKISSLLEKTKPTFWLGLRLTAKFKTVSVLKYQKFIFNEQWA